MAGRLSDARGPRGDVGVLGHLPAASLAQALERAPSIVVVTEGPEHRLAFANRAARRLSRSEVQGEPVPERYSEVDWADWEHVYRTGEAVERPARPIRLRAQDGRVITLRWMLAPLASPEGPVHGVVLVAEDMSEAAAAERRAQRARLLADLSMVVSGAPDAPSALRALADSLVPAVADVAAVYVRPARPSAGDPDQVPPLALALADHLAPLGPPPAPDGPAASPGRWDAELAAGETVRIILDEVTLPLVAPDAPRREWLRAAGATSLVVVPIVAAGELSGGLVVMTAAGRPPFEDEDGAWLADVAARAGVAIADVRTRAAVREVAVRLQRALLPVRPAPPPGLEVAARYVAGSAEADVGGDWWEVIDLGSGVVGLGLGDVSGRGVGAAALMGQARVAMRAAAQAHLSPAQVLGLLDAHLSEVVEREWRDGLELFRFATAVYAVLDVGSGLLRVASAGHLPLLVRGAGGGVRALQVPPAPPLGLGVGAFEEVGDALRPGEVVLAYTDGLVEVRGRSLDAGIDQLRSVLGSHGAAADLEDLADRLVRDMSTVTGGEDDVALLVARRPG